MEGWIKLHRGLLDNDLWKSEPFSRGQAWVDLLLLANHKESFFYKRGNKVIVKRGQVGRSSVELSDRWKWSRTKINKFLKDLEKEQQIIIHKSNVTQLLTLVNYDVYQEKEQQTGQQKNNRKAAEVQQKDTYKNDKKEKNEEEGKERSKDIVNVIDVCTFFQSETGKKLIIGKTDAKIKAGNKYKLINARIKEGASIDDCKAVIKFKNKKWGNDEKTNEWVRISTLFARKNFTNYLEEILNEDKYKQDDNFLTLEQHLEKYCKPKEIERFKKMGNYDIWIKKFETETFKFKNLAKVYSNPTITAAFLFELCFLPYGRNIGGTKPEAKLKSFKRFFEEQSSYNKNKGEIRDLFKKWAKVKA